MTQMQTEILTIEQILTHFEQVLSSLSEKERNVIERRIGLKWHRETLQSIGNSFRPAITRERVRQIEDAGIKKVGRIIKATELSQIQEKARQILALHGGVMTRDTLVGALIKELALSQNVNSYILEVIVQSDYDTLRSKPKLGTRTYFHTPKINKKQVDAVHREAMRVLKKKKDVMDRKELYDTICEGAKIELGNLWVTFIDSTLDIFEDIVKGEETLIGLTRWKILNPKTLKDKAIYVMKKEKVPMHFVDISNKISAYLGESVKVNTIHNELIRNEEFILIGRGIYALREWGFKPGTVLDVVVDILSKEGGPLATEEIIKRVLKVRDVKKTTIYMNLQNKKTIERVGRNFYQLKA
jgi:Sigma-70, region 4